MSAVWFLVVLLLLGVCAARMAARAARAELDRQQTHITKMLAQFDIERWEAEL